MQIYTIYELPIFNKFGRILLMASKPLHENPSHPYRKHWLSGRGL